jgi:hypothetical protein
MMKRTIDEKKFATICGLSYGFVKVLRRKGLIPGHIKTGRKISYLYPEHVEEFLKNREQRAAL